MSQTSIILSSHITIGTVIKEEFLSGGDILNSYLLINVLSGSIYILIANISFSQTENMYATQKKKDPTLNDLFLAHLPTFLCPPSFPSLLPSFHCFFLSFLPSFCFSFLSLALSILRYQYEKFTAHFRLSLPRLISFLYPSSPPCGLLTIITCASCRPSGPRNCSVSLLIPVLSRGKFVCCQVNVSDSHVSWIHVRFAQFANSIHWLKI